MAEIAYFLGILTGLALSCVLLVWVLIFRNKIERAIHKVQAVTAEKGQIFEPDSGDVEGWVNSLSQEHLKANNDL